MKNKTLTYIFLAIETISVLVIGVMGCIEGPTKLLKSIATILLILSILAIANLFRFNMAKSKQNIIDLIISLIVIIVNREFLGFILGWEQCPMI